MTIPYKIQFASVRKTYSSSTEEITAIRNVDFGVEVGEFIALLGPSGCGKTTILNLIAGFIEPTAGEILIDGKHGTASNLRLGMVFQGDATFPWMTVVQNLAYSLNGSSFSKAEAHRSVSDYLQVLGLNDFGSKFPSELSAGMRKRVELGRAYVSDPEVLLLDEPFGSLDVLTKQEMHLLLNQIWQESRKTVVFVTHDIEEAIFLSNRVLVMSSRPGMINSEFQVPFEMPRKPELKLTESFVDLRRTIMSHLESNPH